MSKVAIICGGAEKVWQEIDLARELCKECCTIFFICNDMISEFDGHAIAVTLHPLKLRSWLSCREMKGFAKPSQVWSIEMKTVGVPEGLVTNATEDWHGSVGLFATKVARQLGFERIILCGVPMSIEAGHFKRKTPWLSATTFIGDGRRGWIKRLNEIRPFVRSWSGWTKEQFGEPTQEWLNAK